MLDQSSGGPWGVWQLEKKNQKNIRGDVQVIINIAKLQATEIMQKQALEDLKMDAYIQLRDMLSLLKLENGFLFNPLLEMETIDHYKNPRPLSTKFRSKILDTLLSEEIERSEHEEQEYRRFKNKVLPYLPPYDVNPQ